MRMRASFALAAVAALSAAACGGPKAKPLSVRLTAAELVNPGPSGEARAVVVRVVQMTGSDAFMTADYRSLASDSEGAVGEDFLSSEEVLIAPGKSETLDLEIDPEAEHIGVIALVRNPSAVKWRAIQPVKARRLEKVRGRRVIRIGVDAEAVHIEAK